MDLTNPQDFSRFVTNVEAVVGSRLRAAHDEDPMWIGLMLARYPLRSWPEPQIKPFAQALPDRPTAQGYIQSDLRTDSVLAKALSFARRAERASSRLERLAHLPTFQAIDAELAKLDDRTVTQIATLVPAGTWADEADPATAFRHRVEMLANALLARRRRSPEPAPEFTTRDQELPADKVPDVVSGLESLMAQASHAATDPGTPELVARQLELWLRTLRDHLDAVVEPDVPTVERAAAKLAALLGPTSDEVRGLNHALEGAAGGAAEATELTDVLAELNEGAGQLGGDDPAADAELANGLVEKLAELDERLDRIEAAQAAQKDASTGTGASTDAGETGGRGKVLTSTRVRRLLVSAGVLGSMPALPAIIRFVETAVANFFH